MLELLAADHAATLGVVEEAVGAEVILAVAAVVAAVVEEGEVGAVGVVGVGVDELNSTK